MTESDKTALMVVLGVGAVVAFLLLRQSDQSAVNLAASAPARAWAPVTSYENEETWTIERGPGGRLRNISIHRDASVSGAA